ncbi:UvrD-helicase domain-containing protein [Bosea sp. ANAM02]|uniref:UvrD-helicase domain-containing protein n=1 Tax=Bosea sp. ANAM02 TaxID=2020412 RepID=UPI00140EF250|nr:UvrD-helicase domain-containing protein [Bosea sp. ANAM02]BCB22431.1 DNA helicase [Bosea sp. ANAM02]
MNAPVRMLSDQPQRLAAMTEHDRSLLIEAGAGSGKTAVMAGRVTMLLAEGELPKCIAAVTFTELAASELLARVRLFVERLVAGDVPVELKLALPSGPSAIQIENLRNALDTLDELVCSTIHGFAQRLISPYPAEANIDPGAGVADRNDAELAFSDLRDAWIRERLGEGGSELLIELVGIDPGETVGSINRVSDAMRQRRDVLPPPVRPLVDLVDGFVAAVAGFRSFIGGLSVWDADTPLWVADLEDMVDQAAAARDAAGAHALALLIRIEPSDRIATKSGSLRAYQRKTGWKNAAKAGGLSAAEADRLFAEADGHYAACKDAWGALIVGVGAHLLAALMQEVRPLLQRFRDYKREAALLDFDDLIYAARDLLRDHETVRVALSQRYRRVLVDEFQDTDPLQAEIFWRLCGEAPTPETPWQQRVLRPGALFLVGDPKQAIYRFRGADVRAYVEAREAIAAQSSDDVLSIATNFRSCKSILEFVNGRFETPLSVENAQPGFTALDHFHDDVGSHPCVTALDVWVDDDANADAIRNAEAEAVAETCARMIGSAEVTDHLTGGRRLCRAGDIALLAPTGTDLWRYEEALERYGIPVATQAGKGFFWRQEIQDLIAVTRVLADSRDTLAFGALMRGPVVGLTEEELLDIGFALPERESGHGKERFSLRTEPELVTHPVARDVLERLQGLWRRSNATTPYDLLSQAVAELRIRPTLLARHKGQAERALANVDLYLGMSRSYVARGLRAFAEAMTTAWEDEERAGEGRPDAQEQSVSLITMHSSKGLEWPVVIPVNTSTGLKEGVSTIISRETGQLYTKVFGIAPDGFAEAAEGEKAEITRERVRLWYVAATRARELLIVPRPSSGVANGTWIGVVDLALGDLPALDLSAYEPELPASASPRANQQTRDVFADEASRVVAASRSLHWKSPSRHEDADKPDAIDEVAVVVTAAEDGDTTAAAPAIQGGRIRGLVMHKLAEEILTGEVAEEAVALEARARELLVELGTTEAVSAEEGFVASEMAGAVLRALQLPEILAVRDRLVPECHVYAFASDGSVDTVTYGIADAIAFDGARPTLVIDWKSDVNPDAATILAYRGQVGDYLKATGVPVGLIVFPTTGRVERVAA